MLLSICQSCLQLRGLYFFILEAFLQNNVTHRDQITIMEHEQRRIAKIIERLQLCEEIEEILEHIQTQPDTIYFYPESHKVIQEVAKYKGRIYTCEEIDYVETFARTDGNGLDEMEWIESDCNLEKEDECAETEDTEIFTHGLSYKNQFFPDFVNDVFRFSCEPGKHGRWEKAHVICRLTAIVHPETWQKCLDFWKEAIARSN
jgi:hypothetical protein